MAKVDESEVVPGKGGQMEEQQPLARQLAEDILQLAKRSDTEEDLRIGVNAVQVPMRAADLHKTTMRRTRHGDRHTGWIVG